MGHPRLEEHAHAIPTYVGTWTCHPTGGHGAPVLGHGGSTTHPSMKARCMSTAVLPEGVRRVTIPVFYPSLGAGLAQVGAFEIVMTAPSTYEWAHRPTQGWDERVITSTGPRHGSFLHTLRRQASRAASDGTASGPIDWPPPPPPDTSACRARSAPGQTSSSRGRTG